MNGPEIPEKAPHNPYALGEPLTSELSVGPLEEPRAKGLDGDMLDSLLKSRMVEGMRLGHRDGRQEASARYSDIFDEGYRAGAGEGFQQGRDQMASASMELLNALRLNLIHLSARAKKGGRVENDCEAMLDAIAEFFGPGK